MLMISSRLNDKIMQLGAFEWVILVKNVFFRHFPIVFYRKYSKIKRIVFRTCCPWFQGLIFCTEPCLDTLEAWWKGQNGPLSFSLNSFSANDSRVCASDRNVSPFCYLNLPQLVHFRCIFARSAKKIANFFACCAIFFCLEGKSRIKI